MNDLKANSSDWAARSKTNTARLRNWTGAWLVTLAVATFGPLLVWQGNHLLTSLAVFLNLAAGFGMIMANKHHLQGLDEMQQKIQLEAMALSLGVGLVVGLAYSSMDVASLIPFDAEISHLVILIGLTYGAGIFFGRRRYQ